jgi:hypothetical protein
MEGYVYIARIIDHGGNFVNGYHKIGLSKQYKIRETQLNSTHLPFDVLMIRVFETEDMDKLEGILHVCFDDYRVIKEYDDRRNITTEWFNVGDIDSFNERIDKMVGYLDIKEIDLGFSVDNDMTLTEEEKSVVKKTIGRAKSTNLKVTIGDKVYMNNTAKETYVEVMNRIVEGKDNDELEDTFNAFFRKDKNSFAESLADYNKVLMENGLYMSTWGSNVTKIKRIEMVAKEFGVDDIICEIV